LKTPQKKEQLLIFFRTQQEVSPATKIFQYCQKTGKFFASKGDRNVHEFGITLAKQSITARSPSLISGMTCPPELVYRNKRIQSEITRRVPDDLGWGTALLDGRQQKSFMKTLEIFPPHIYENITSNSPLSFLSMAPGPIELNLLVPE
jgi:hypothetical protein